MCPMTYTMVNPRFYPRKAPRTLKSVLERNVKGKKERGENKQREVTNFGRES